MDIFSILSDEVKGFFGISGLLDMYKSGDYSKLLTLDGVFAAVSPIMPLILVIEIIRAFVYKRFRIEDYKMSFLVFVFNRFVSRFISIAALAFCIGLLQEYAIFQSTFKWYWIIYGYIVWELGHFIYHYLAHKVRIFWCLHSTHHAPQSMNLFVNFSHFFLEAPYADVIRTSTCILLGVSPPLLFLIMFIDGFWGTFIHVGENVIKDGRLGFLNNIILTPSHHRVHHSKNPQYLDTNFCNLLNIWDRFFKTYKIEERETLPVYGITRTMNANSFVDVYFGEIFLLWKDVRKAPGLKNKLLYIIMPPGWNHTGKHTTAKIIKEEFDKQHTYSNREYEQTV